MGKFKPFIDHFGAAAEGSELPLESFGLAKTATLKEFTEEVGGGIFASGLLSILSVREQVSSLGGWEKWIPAGCRLFASSGLGMLFLSSFEDLWLIDTQFGEVVESDMPLVHLLNGFSEEEMREGFMFESLFQAWVKRSGALESRQVLAPTPALALGGELELSSLEPVSMEVYLSMTAQLFSGEGDLRVDVRRLGMG
jgi:hypothetical protein